MVATSTRQMRAARIYGKEDVRIMHDVPYPECAAGQVIVEPAFVGICGTDLHEFLEPTFTPLKNPHPVTKESVPITIGHEFSGTIVQVGAGVDDLHIGQKVAVQPTIYCGGCTPCNLGLVNVCQQGGFIGLSGGGGGMSEAVAVAAEAALPLPDSIDLDIGALVEPLAVAWHAVDASPIAHVPEAQVLVLGGGPIGLAVVQVLLARGAKLVICAEVAAKRQEFARDFGAHHVLDPTKVDVLTTAKELFGGESGPDIVFDCAGVPQSIEIACKVVRPRGAVINVAIWEKPVSFNPNWFVFSEATYSGVLGYRRKDFLGVIDAIASGRLNPAKMITSIIRMEDLIDKGYRALINEKDKHVKILVDIKA